MAAAAAGGARRAAARATHGVGAGAVALLEASAVRFERLRPAGRKRDDRRHVKTAGFDGNQSERFRLKADAATRDFSCSVVTQHSWEEEEKKNRWSRDCIWCHGGHALRRVAPRDAFPI